MAPSVNPPLATCWSCRLVKVIRWTGLFFELVGFFGTGLKKAQQARHPGWHTLMGAGLLLQRGWLLADVLCRDGEGSCYCVDGFWLLGGGLLADVGDLAAVWRASG